MDKASVLAALRARLAHDFRTAAQSQQRTQLGATHEESRPENDKDTRALEASYLARGQAQRVAELEAALRTLAALELKPIAADAAIALSALVLVEDHSGLTTYFISPTGGGLDLDVTGNRVLVVTPQSPIGRTLLGRRSGDSIEVRTPRGLHEYEIVGVT